MGTHGAATPRKHVQVGSGRHGGNIELGNNFLNGDSALFFDNLLHFLAPLFGERPMLSGSDWAFHDLIVNDRVKDTKGFRRESPKPGTSVERGLEIPELIRSVAKSKEPLARKKKDNEG